MGTISMAHIVYQYAILTFGEILLSTTALEFSYTQAPNDVKAISTALWYSTTAFANVVVIALKSMESLSRSAQLLSSAWMVVAATLAFVYVASRFNVLDTHEVEHLDRKDEDKHGLASMLKPGQAGIVDTSSNSNSFEDVANSRTPMVR